MAPCALYVSTQGSMEFCIGMYVQLGPSPLGLPYRWHCLRMLFSLQARVICGGVVSLVNINPKGDKKCTLHSFVCISNDKIRSMGRTCRQLLVAMSLTMNSRGHDLCFNRSFNMRVTVRSLFESLTAMLQLGFLNSWILCLILWCVCSCRYV